MTGGRISIAAAALFLGLGPGAPQPTIAQSEADHVSAVYRITIDFLFFNELYEQLGATDFPVPELLVVEDSTGFDLPEMSDETPEHLRLLLRLTLPAASPVVIEGLFRVNQSATPVRLPEFAVPTRYVSWQLVDSLLNAGGVRDGWDLFHRRFPGAQGLMTVSAVGFDPEYRQAMVYITNGRGLLDAMGLLFLLERTENTWRILAYHQVWVS